MFSGCNAVDGVISPLQFLPLSPEVPSTVIPGRVPTPLFPPWSAPPCYEQDRSPLKRRRRSGTLVPGSRNSAAETPRSPPAADTDSAPGPRLTCAVICREAGRAEFGSFGVRRSVQQVLGHLHLLAETARGAGGGLTSRSEQAS